MEYTYIDGILRVGAGEHRIPPEFFMLDVSLVEVYLPDSIQVIGRNAFLGCVALGYVRFPKSGCDIHDGAFRGCPSLWNADNADKIDRAGVTAFEEAPLRDCFRLTQFKDYLVPGGENGYL